MVKRAFTETVDDLDGMSGTDISTVYFQLDDVEYEIDLRASNAAKLREALAPFVAAGARRYDTKVIREWARSNGLTPCEMGTLPVSVVSAFKKATYSGLPPWVDE